jgi:hypothetical protein
MQHAGTGSLRKFKAAVEICLCPALIPYVEGMPGCHPEERIPMRTPFADRGEFEDKAAALAAAIDTDTRQAQQLLARLAGYDDAAAIEYGAGDRSNWSSREELIARLLASKPELADDKAANVIDGLALAVRDADIEHIASSPDVIPNIGG